MEDTAKYPLLDMEHLAPEHNLDNTPSAVNQQQQPTKELPPQQGEETANNAESQPSISTESAGVTQPQLQQPQLDTSSDFGEVVKAATAASNAANKAQLTYQQQMAVNTLAQLTPMKVNDEYSRMLRQVEFYFSDTNLPRDKFLKHLLGIDELDNDPIIAKQFVPLEVLINFNKVKTISGDIEVLREAIRRSDGLVKLNPEETGVIRTTPLPSKPPKDKKKKRKKSKPKVLEIGAPGDIDLSEGSSSSMPNTPQTPADLVSPSPLSAAEERDMRTIIVECLPQGYDRSCVERDFGKYGPLDEIEINQRQGFDRGGVARLVFSNLEDATQALMEHSAGAGENNWRRQSIKVTSMRDVVMNKHANARNRRGSVSSTNATALLNAGIPLVPQSSPYIRRQSLPGRMQPRRTSFPSPYQGGDYHHPQQHIFQNYSFGDSQSTNTTTTPSNPPSSWTEIVANAAGVTRRISTDVGQHSGGINRYTPPRRMSVSNVVSGGHVSFSTSALQPQGQSLQPPQMQATQPRRNSIADAMQRNRLVSQHGILSVHGPSGSVQNDFRVVYARGPDNTRGFTRSAAGRGKAQQQPQRREQEPSISAKS